jgi:replicative DNA helicase
MAKQIFEQMDSFFSGKDSRMTYDLGFGQLDGMIGGIEMGKLLVVAGQANDGREALMYTFIKHLAFDLQKPSLVINLATSEDTFYYKLMSNVTGISIDDIRKEDIIDKMKLFEKSKIYVEFPKDRSLEHIEQLIREYAAKGVELFFIDKFQAIDYKDDIEYCFDDELLFYKEKNSRHLYLLAKDLRINIFTGSTVSDFAFDREGIEGIRPNLSDLVRPGRLDEYSDVIFGVFVPYVHQIFINYDGKDFRDIIEVTILKNNINQKLGRFSLKYDYCRNRVLDNKEYNREIYEKLRAKNPALNELVVGMGLTPEIE